MNKNKKTDTKAKKYDFGGYATKFNVKCSDGRVITDQAFKHLDGETRPLLFQHMHNDPTNVLGNVLLELREDGVYAHGRFNDTTSGQNAKQLVEHGDIESLSIFANGLKQNGNNVTHGNIREVSLVLAGANPGAVIDNLSFSHADGSIHVDEEEAIIFSDFLFHSEEEPNEEEVIEHKDEEGPTLNEVFNTLNDDQKTLLYYTVTAAVSKDGLEENVKHEDQGGNEQVKTNVFEQKTDKDNALIHSIVSPEEFQGIVKQAAEMKGSLRDAFLAHADEINLPEAGVDYGIASIDTLFPDPTVVGGTPTWISRDMKWVAGVLSGVKHSPFSRIKTRTADITAEEARAKGYVKGTMKKDEVFSLLSRTTNPTTIYKRQKLDRDDILDITDFDVVAWVRAEMRMMLNEELARAILVSDGRELSDPDKIKDPVGATEGTGIRSIYHDNDTYAHRVVVEEDVEGSALIKAILKARKHYKGAGSPTFYTTSDVVIDLLLLEDAVGRRLYETEKALADALRVSNIVEVEVMEGMSQDGKDLIGIIVNLSDYTVGADKGGQITPFDDFDIDFNQYKYLLETRASGALTNPKTALVIERVQADEEDEPVEQG